MPKSQSKSQPKPSSKEAAKAAAPPPQESSSDDESSADEMTLREGEAWGEYSSESDDDDDDGDSAAAAPAKKSSSSKSSSSSQSSSKKKKRSGSDGSDSDSSDTYTFAIAEPDPELHFHGLRTLLQSSPLYVGVATPLTDALLAQASVGGLIIQELEAPPPPPASKKKGSSSKASSAPAAASEAPVDIFAFLSVANLHDEEFAKTVGVLMSSTIRAQCPKETLASFDAFVSQSPDKGSKHPEVGLVVSERLVNLPLSLVHALHASLTEDIEWAANNATGDGGKERLLYRFGRFLHVCALEDDGSEGGKASESIASDVAEQCRKYEDECAVKSGSSGKKKAFEPFIIKVKKGAGVDGTVRYLVAGATRDARLQSLEELKKAF